jgi:hypothetical protein
MASMTMTKARECPDCGKVHDCAFFVEMQVLTEKLDKKINEFVEQYQKVEKTIHELEDK